MVDIFVGFMSKAVRVSNDEPADSPIKWSVIMPNV
jgi:hypothetical protein